MAPFPSPTKAWRTTAYETISPTRPELSAAGKSVLVTGGGSGIGAQTALSFALAGASHIALLGRRTQPLVDTKVAILKQSPKTEVFTASVDIRDKEQVDKAFADFLGDSKLDVVISNAATVGPQEPIDDVEPEAFMRAIDTDVRGNLYIAQAFLRYRAKESVAINTNSSAAHLNFGPGFASYGIAKLAVFRLWDSVGFAHQNGLRVYHVQPGVVDTDMNKEAGGVKAMGFEDHVSLPASFYVWLASPEAAFLRGKFLWANWDVDELKSRAKELEDSRELNFDLVGWPFGEPRWSLQLAGSFGSEEA